jgi:hypothetical protein
MEATYGFALQVTGQITQILIFYTAEQITPKVAYD